jgi:Protein of unknown function (DUF1006).
VEAGDLVSVDVEGVRGERFVLREEVELLESPPEPATSVAFLAPLDPLMWDRALLRTAVRLRLHLGGLRSGSEAQVGLLRAADPLPRPSRRPHRAAHRPRRPPCAGARRLVGGRLRPAEGDGFVDAMRDALRAYLGFAGATRIEWAPQLGKEKRLFLTRP